MAIRNQLLITLIAAMAACSPLPSTLHDRQWAYLEDWDINKNSKLDATEFERGYLESKFFYNWAGKKKSIANKQLADKLLGSSAGLKRSMSASLGKDTVASNRSDENESHSTAVNDALPFFVDRADDDHDGNITNQEWARAMYRLADENSDMTVSPLEFYLWQLLRG